MRSEVNIIFFCFSLRCIILGYTIASSPNRYCRRFLFCVDAWASSHWCCFCFNFRWLFSSPRFLFNGNFENRILVLETRARIIHLELHFRMSLLETRLFPIFFSMFWPSKRFVIYSSGMFNVHTTTLAVSGKGASWKKRWLNAQIQMWLWLAMDNSRWFSHKQ